jgi:hypothetical protein
MKPKMPRKTRSPYYIMRVPHIELAGGLWKAYSALLDGTHHPKNIAARVWVQERNQKEGRI